MRDIAELIYKLYYIIIESYVKVRSFILCAWLRIIGLKIGRNIKFYGKLKLKLNGKASQIVISDNVGNYNTTTGVVSIEGLNPSAFIGSEVKLFVTPANQSTVRPLLNYVIDIDDTRSTVTTIIDRELKVLRSYL